MVEYQITDFAVMMICIAVIAVVGTIAWAVVSLYGKPSPAVRPWYADMVRHPDVWSVTQWGDSEGDEDRESFYQDDPPSFSYDPMNESDCGKCHHCGAWLTAVRPGKSQCDNCGDDYQSKPEDWEERPTTHP